ncbi:MAG: substrate-binding domain-containing protein [Pseudonocardiaceae bacterium]
MKILDRDAYPARFALVTSVVSGLAVATIAGVSQVVGNQFLTYQAPLWLFLLLGVSGISLLGVTLHLKKKDQIPIQNNQVFLILCAFTEKRWVAGLIQDLHNSLDRRGFDLVLKIPERDYVHLGQVRHFRNLSRQRGRYIGGIISPAEPELLRRDLKEFCSSTDYPIILIDIDPFDDAEEYPIGTAFVGYHPDVIGHCAADYVGEHATRMRILCPEILIIGSKLHTGRQTAFVKQMRNWFKDAKFVIDEDGEFNRANAREIVCANLRSKEGVVPNYIFCTNDEMALGAVDALGLLGLGNDGSIVVVGVDGTPEARALIDSQTTALRATVVQDSCRIAEIATDLLDKAIRGGHVEKYNYLHPRIYSKDR